MTHTTANSGTVEHIDPSTLVLEANVRPSAPLTPAFIASIREHGVLTPVLARRDDNGNVIIRAGQRRTLASREAGLSTIPVYIVDADEATAERIIQQMVENDQREALTDGDRAVAFRQLAFEGLTVAAIAKRTGTKAAEVKTAIAVAENPAAASAIHEYSITLDQAAALIEFEDSPELRDNLIEIASTEPSQFAHATQRARDQREREQKQAAAEAGLLERGYEVLDHEPDYHSREIVSLSNLATADGQRVTVEQINALEGRAAFVRIYYSGEPVIRYYLRDPESAGFINTDRNSGTTSGPMTDEQKEERRILIANNKAWDSAETVRRAWLTALLSRKTLPKDTAVVIANGLTLHRHAISRFTGEGNVLAHSLLGIDRGPGWGSDQLATFTAHNPAKATHVALAIVLGAIESSTSRDTWRNPTAVNRTYFAQLADWGYELSEVETILTTEP